MPCYFPLTGFPSPTGGRLSFTRPAGHSGREVQVKCGQCLGCRLDYSSQWATRLVGESLYHEDSWFFTGTLSPERFGAETSLDKRVIPLFMKRLRKRGFSPRYMGVGEYGERTRRAHYHAALFGVPLDDLQPFKDNGRGDSLFTSEFLSEVWGLGHVLIGALSHTSAAYVAGYCLRDKRAKEPGSCDVMVPDTGEVVPRELPFVCMSRRPGIGRRYVEDYGGQLAAGDFVVVNGRKVGTPAYYHRVLEGLNSSLVERLKADREAEVYSDRAKRERRPARLAVRLKCREASLRVSRRGSARDSV